MFGSVVFVELYSWLCKLLLVCFDIIDALIPGMAQGPYPQETVYTL